MESMIGQTLGQYQLVEQIGKGGMATVYKAFQPGLNRYVAVKVLPAYYAHESGFAARFTREAQAIAQLDHPHILPVYDFGKQGDISYIVMKYVAAGSLRDTLGRPLAPAQAVEIIEQIAGALDVAHERGILHRDVKPGNVLIDERGWIYLSDFGLAKMVESSVQLTGSGVGVGTPAYMSPEQGQGLPVDARTDIYALGVILFEMLTGHVPYEAETPMAIVIKHITAPIPMPRQINPNIPEPVERVLLKALAKDREDRFASAGLMAAALRRAVQGLDPHIAAAPIPTEFEATALHRPVSYPSGTIAEPLPAPSRSTLPPPPSYPVKSKQVPWLPIAGGLGLLAFGAAGLLAGLLYLSSRSPVNLTPTPVSVVAVESPTPALPTPRLVEATPTSTPPPLPTDTPAPQSELISQGDPLAQDTATPLSPADTPASTDTPTSTPMPVVALPEISPTPTFTPNPTPTFTPTPSIITCAVEPQGMFRNLWLKYKDRLGCPHRPDPVGGFYAEQPFQNGHMFWSKLGQLYLATMGTDRGTWRLFPENESTWKEGMPPKSCEVTVPPNLVQPVRGFGGLWCTYADIRERIGYGLADERGFEDGIDFIQGFDGGVIFRDSDGQSRGLAYVLFEDDMTFEREAY